MSNDVTIFAVSQDDYDSQEVLSVWSTVEKAETELQRLTGDGGATFRIDELQLDKPF